MKLARRIVWWRSLPPPRRIRAAARPRRRPSCWSTRRSRPTSSRPTRKAFNKAVPDVEIKWVRDSTGVITAKLLAEKANPQADVDLGPRRDEPAGAGERGHAAAVRADGPRRDRAAVQGHEESAGLVGDGRLGRDGLLQHGRGGEDEPAQARDLAGPDQAGLQGQDRDAEPGVVRHRLPRRDRVAADHGRAERLEVHGRAAREHRAVHALGQQAVRAGGQRRVPDRHLVRVSRQHDQGQGRPDRPHLPQGRPGLGHGGVRRS